MKRIRVYKLHSHCAVEEKNFERTTCTTVFINKCISWSERLNHQTTISNLIVGEDKLKSEWLKKKRCKCQKVKSLPNWHQPTLPIISFLQIFLTRSSWYLSKSKCPVCAHSFYFTKKLPEEFLDGTEADSYFHHNIFDTYQSQHQFVGVSKGSNKKSFAFTLSPFCGLKAPLLYILQVQLKISKRKLSSLVGSLRGLLKKFDTASKCLQSPLLKPKVDIGSTKAKDKLFAQY